MKKIQIKDMDLQQIALSGQCFRMNRIEGNTYAVTAFGRYLEITQEGDFFTFSCTEEEFEYIWTEYFDLHMDYGKIKGLVDSNDTYLNEAIQFGWGVRILKQDLWEMIITFLISQNNNILRIKRSIELLCENLGKKEQTKNKTIYYTFPNAEDIASSGMEKLKTMGFGYRDKYLFHLAQEVVQGNLNLEELKQADYETAHQILMKQYGIGKKVADCICLYGLYHIDAFPLDTHMKKILDKYYQSGFPYEHYKGYLGIVQQYLFYYDLKGERGS